MLIANPNCSTIQSVLAIAIIYKAYGIERIIYNTYQAVSGGGEKALEDLYAKKNDYWKYKIYDNMIPQIDSFLDNGCTKEEMKMVNESRKILGDDELKITATAIRVPVSNSHGVSINLELKKDFDLKDIRELLKNFSTLDSFDNHSKIKDYYKKMDKIARENETLALISTGWDPGLFSLNRIIGQAILPQGESYTLWGKGVSQGHSAAVRSIEGVLDAIQYTIPKEEILEKIRSGEDFNYDSHKAHLREVYVVVEDGADKEEIEGKIKSMPDYFAPYETHVHFIEQDDLDKNHKSMVHGGHVFRRGKASGDGDALMEFALDLKSNPDFTAAVDIAYARALYRLKQEGKKGAITVLDVAPKYLLEESYDLLLNLI